jgi:hypothetical protein
MRAWHLAGMFGMAVAVASCSGGGSGSTAAGAGGHTGASSTSGGGAGGGAGGGTGGGTGGSSPTTLYNATLFNNDLIALDSTSVYVVQLNAGSPDTVMKVPIHAGGTAKQIAPATTSGGIDNIRGLAVDAESVYWVEFTGDVVMKAPIAGGSPTTLASGQAGPVAMALDASNVYWSNLQDSTIMKVPIGGGTPTMVTSATGPRTLAVDSSNIYFSVDTAVLAAPIGGGATTTLTPGTGVIDQIVVDSGTLYWTVTGGAVMSMPVAGGTPKTVYAGVSSELSFSLAVDATSVYVAGDGDGCASTPFGVTSVPHGGGKGTTLVTGLFGNALAVDSASVYTFTGGCLGGGVNVVKFPN